MKHYVYYREDGTIQFGDSTHLDDVVHDLPGLRCLEVDEAYMGQGGKVVDGVVVATTPAPVTIAEMQATAWNSIKNTRDRLEYGNFSYGEWVFQINKEDITGAAFDAFLAKQSGDDSFRQFWVLADNTTVSLTADQVIAVARSMKAYVTGLHETSSALRAQIDATTTADAVKAITWPAG